MEKHLQIHTIYNKEDRLNTVLDTIKNTKDNILVNNLITKLKIGGSKFHTVFDKAIYNESTKQLILILRDCDIDLEILEQMLKNKNILCNEIKFDDYEHFKKRTGKRLEFITDSRGLEKTLIESKNSGETSCRFYQYLTGHFDLRYYINNIENLELDEYYIKGVIEFEHKILFLINHKQPYNVYKKKALRILLSLDIDTIVDDSKEMIIEEKPKKYKKK